LFQGAWIAKQRFAGYLFWSIDFDDFNGKFCGQGKNPLQKAVMKGIKEGIAAGFSSTNDNTGSDAASGE